MSSEEYEGTYRKLDEMQVATSRFSVKSRDEIWPKLDVIAESCDGCISGPPIIIFHEDTGVDGFDVEVGYPVSTLIETDEIKTRVLKAVPAMTMYHFGSFEKLGESYLALLGQITEEGRMSGKTRREVFHELTLDNPDDTVIELQIGLFERNN